MRVFSSHSNPTEVEVVLPSILSRLYSAVVPPLSLSLKDILLHKEKNTKTKPF